MSAFLPVPDPDERTLLRELAHRINNELASAINIVCTAAVRRGLRASSMGLIVPCIAKVIRKLRFIRTPMSVAKPTPSRS